LAIDGADAGGPVHLVAGEASFAPPAMTSGTHDLTVRYLGSPACLASASAVLHQVMLPACAQIRSVRDVPGDQGRLVRITVARSPLDAPGSPAPIVRY